MEILLDVIVAGLVAGGVAGGIVLMGRSRAPRHAAAGPAGMPIPATPVAATRAEEADDAGPALAVAVDPGARAALRGEIDDELRARRAEIARIEEPLITK